MPDRGQPIVDGAPACPFVAFEDDRDARAPGPDHRHRCYAEVRPAPRALAHQEAYCLSSAFAVCPTFQDWARREAARPSAAPPEPPAAVVIPGAGTGPGATDRTVVPPPPEPPRRNPPRDWSAPPPWLGGDQGDEEDEVQAIPARGGAGPGDSRGGRPASDTTAGLAGSFAARMLGDERLIEPDPVARPAEAGVPSRIEVSAAPSADRPPDGIPAVAPALPAVAPEPVRRRLEETDELDVERRPRGRMMARRQAPRMRGAEERTGPSWERPRRIEAYPTLKTRMGLGGIAVPPMLVGVLAVVVAAVALFFLPAILPLGGTSAPTAGPSASAAASGAVASPTAASPTPVPQPTAQLYVVQPNDTFTKIAARFGIPLQALIDANKSTVPNPNKVQIGQQIVIPVVAPTSLPDAGSQPPTVLPNAASPSP